MKQFLHASPYGKLIAIIGLLLVLLLVFFAGSAVGYHEAIFSQHWNDNYAGRFAGPGSPFMSMTGDRDSSPNSHGAFGEVVALRLPTIIIKGPSEAEKAVTVGPNTSIRKFHALASTSDIVLGDTVVIIGEPDEQGGIRASLIRIVPAMSTSTASTSALASPR